jgi:hypothetical protein
MQALQAGIWPEEKLFIASVAVLHHLQKNRRGHVTPEFSVPLAASLTSRHRRSRQRAKVVRNTQGDGTTRSKFIARRSDPTSSGTR